MPKIVFKNILDTVNSLLSHASTVAREWGLPDKDGTVALLDDTQSEEFNRTFSETIVFDKNEIFYSIHTLTGDVNYTIGVGSLSNLSSSARQKITTDGTHAINFGPGFDFIYGISNGQILEAGTYEVYFFFENGSVSVNFPGTSQQASGLIQLTAPANFAAASNGTDEIDLEWDAVSGASSYRLEYSFTGTGGWSLLSTPTSGTTTEVHSSLPPDTTYYYRIKAVGDGVTYTDSPYSTASATTASGADVTAPTFTFSPASGTSIWPVNRALTLTANEPIRNTDGTAITNANVASRLTLKQTNSGGTNISFTATIDASKTIITITPATTLGTNQLVYVAINNVEDNTGNEVTTAISATFTTTEFSYFNGSTNFLTFGDILDSLFATADTNFWIELTVNNIILSGFKFLVAKHSVSTLQRSFVLLHSGADIEFIWSNLTATNQRVVLWTGAIPDSGEHTIQLRYNGAVDTNNGLDRVSLYIDGVLAGSKSMLSTAGTLPDPANANAPLVVGAAVNTSGVGTGAYYAEELKDFVIRSANGATVEIDVPVLRIGTDTSGNSRNGTWV
jgi:hypothetical protein